MNKEERIKKLEAAAVYREGYTEHPPSYVGPVAVYPPITTNEVITAILDHLKLSISSTPEKVVPSKVVLKKWGVNDWSKRGKPQRSTYGPPQGDALGASTSELFIMDGEHPAHSRREGAGRT